MKKGKLNSSGFVLMETLIVTVFVMTIFALLYSNFSPLIAEYEKREFYDDIDGKYAAYWVKRLIEQDDYSIVTSSVENFPYYYEFKCVNLNDSTRRDLCKEMADRLQINHIYITEYGIKNFKEKFPEISDQTGGMHKYVGYLPEFSRGSLNGAEYRVIIEFERKYDENGDDIISDNESYMAYSTFEVVK